MMMLKILQKTVSAASVTGCYPMLLLTDMCRHAPILPDTVLDPALDLAGE